VSLFTHIYYEYVLVYYPSPPPNQHGFISSSMKYKYRYI